MNRLVCWNVWVEFGVLLAFDRINVAKTRDSGLRERIKDRQVPPPNIPAADYAELQGRSCRFITDGD